MTGPQGMGVLLPNIIIPADIGGIGEGGLAQIEYVHSYSGSTKAATAFPHAMHWLPGDYMFVAWRDDLSATLQGIPGWMHRLDGLSLGTNPAIWGGRIPDVFGLSQASTDTNWGMAFTTSLSDQTRTMLAIGIYRHISIVKVVEAYVRERLTATPLNDTIGPVAIPVDGGAILLGTPSVGTDPTYFIFDSPSVERLSDEIASNRATRIFDQLTAGGTSVTFQTNGTGGFPTPGNDNNFFWNLGVNAGPDTYDEPYPAIGLVGTSHGTATGTTITVTLPGSRAAGDLIVVGVHLDSNQSHPTFNSLTGWQRLQFGAGGDAFCVFLKRDNGSESNPTFTAVASDDKQYVCAVYRNVGAVNWVQGATGSTLTPSPTTTIDNTRAIALNASNAFEPITLGTANGYTQQTVHNTTGNGGMSLSDKVFSGVGTTINFPIHSAPNTSFMTSALLTMIPGVGVPVTIPTVTINQGATQADPVIGTPLSIVFDIVFSEPVSTTTFTAADVTLSGTAGATTVALQCTDGLGMTWTATVTGMTTIGTVTASIGAVTCTSVNTGTLNAASSSTDNTVTYHPTDGVEWGAFNRSGTSGTTRTSNPVFPTCTSGDIALLLIVRSNTNNCNTPSGFTLVSRSLNAEVWQKTCAGTESATSVAVTNIASASTISIIGIFRNYLNATPVDVEGVSGNLSSPTDITYPTVTPTTTNSYCIAMACSAVSTSGTPVVPGGTNPTYGLLLDSGHTSSVRMVLFVGMSTSTSALGARTVAETGLDGNFYQGRTIVLKRV